MRRRRRPGSSRSQRPHPAATAVGRLGAADGGKGRLLTVRDVAAILGVSTATVYRLCEEGRLAHVRLGNAIRVGPAYLEKFTGSGRRWPGDRLRAGEEVAIAKFEKGSTAGNATRWQAGKSGNPRGPAAGDPGRPAPAAERAPRAVQRLAELVESTDDRIALAAAVALLDRAGVTPLEIDVPLGSSMPLVDDPLEVPEMDEAEVRRLASTRASSELPSTVSRTADVGSDEAL